MNSPVQNLFVALVLLALSTLNLQLFTAHAQGTAFAYQGQLQSNGSPASGTYNLKFTLFNTNTSGVAVAGPVTNNAVGVTNGLFTVAIDFGSSVWNGQTNWLQIGVETNSGSSSFTTLTPRQQLTPVPYAIYAESASNLSGALSSITLTGPLTLPSTAVTPDIIYSGAALILYGDNNGNFFTGQNAGNSTMTGSGNTANGVFAFFSNTSGERNEASGGQALENNTTGSYNAANGFVALEDNINGTANTANGASALQNNTIGSANTANGFQALQNNTSGSNNIALGYAAGTGITTGSSNIDIGNSGLATDTNIIRIGSGQSETFIAGVITNTSAVMLHAGTDLDLTANNDLNAYVGTDMHLTVINDLSANVGGNMDLTVNNLTVTADAAVSLASGSGMQLQSGAALTVSAAEAVDLNSGTTMTLSGTNLSLNGPVNMNGGNVGIGITNPTAPLYVLSNRTPPAGNSGWAGSVGWFENTSTATNAAPALRVVCDGGTNLDGALSVSSNGKGLIAEFGNADTFVVTITNNGTIYATAFNSTSDRNAKEGFTQINPQDVLAKVAALPITQWSFKLDSGTRHIGPMAQDFHAAFDVGMDDKHIATVDEEGVALAAIQGLNQKLEDTRAENAKLKQQNDSLAERLNELEMTVKQLAAQK